MTHFEFWTNLATVILLVPAIILSFRLSRQLGKLNQNQERMIELAAALRRAAETYGADNGHRVADSTGLSPPRRPPVLHRLLYRQRKNNRRQRQKNRILTGTKAMRRRPKRN